MIYISLHAMSLICLLILILIGEMMTDEIQQEETKFKKYKTTMMAIVLIAAVVWLFGFFVLNFV